MNDGPAICIAGMHRSGTSMLASLLHGCGLNLGRESELIPPTRDNPEGHWEHAQFVAVNDALLDALGGGWDLPPELPARWTSRPEILPLKARAREAIAGFPQDRVWGWKDPRTSLTLDFWRELLPELKVIICVRHPMEVALSLRRRGLSSHAFGFALWMRHHRQALTDTAASARLVTHYDAFFHRPDEELRRVLRFAGIGVDDAVIGECLRRINADARHQRAGTIPANATVLPSDVQELYGELCAMAEWDRNTRLAGRPDTQRPATPADEAEALRKQLWLAECALKEHEAAAAREHTSLERALDEERESAAQVRSILRSANVTLDESAASLLDYEDMLLRVRAAVEAHVSPGAMLLVVSKGDERLVQFAGKRARHFPADADGTYSGYYPADDAEAIAWLDAARAKGADFLVFPVIAFWWLSNYTTLASRLGSSATLVCDQPETCKIFALRDS